eukprot:3197871-Lingulodinium_polyedra.AAC.1
MRDSNPPLRLLATASAQDGQNAWDCTRVDIRLASPRAGHEQYWVVWTQGGLAPGRVEEQLARHFSVVVRAREIVAYHPGRGLDEEAVL